MPAPPGGRLAAFALVLVMGRLASPWQLIRLAVRAADNDDASRIAATPYAIAVTITLGDIERRVGELKDDLKGGRKPVGHLVAQMHS